MGKALPALALVLLPALAPSAPAAASSAAWPNPVFLLADDLGQNPAVVARLAERVLAWQRELPPGPVDATAGRNDYPGPGRARGASADTPTKPKRKTTD